MSSRKAPSIEDRVLQGRKPSLVEGFRQGQRRKEDDCPRSSAVRHQEAIPVWRNDVSLSFLPLGKRECSLNSRTSRQKIQHSGIYVLLWGLLSSVLWFQLELALNNQQSNEA